MLAVASLSTCWSPGDEAELLRCPLQRVMRRLQHLRELLLLLRSGYPPAVIHSTERQRYYEALKGSSATMYSIVQDAIENSLSSIEKLIGAYDSR